MPACPTHFHILRKAKEHPGLRGTALYALATTSPTVKPPRSNERVAKAAFLGSVGPDLPFFSKRDQTKGSVGPLLHHKKTGVMVANMLDRLRPPRAVRRDMQRLAFVLGYISHIAADIMIHPYVNLFAGECELQKQRHMWFIYHDRIAGDVAMHMHCECHMDVWVAETLFGTTVKQRGWAGWEDFVVTGEDAADAYGMFVETIRRTYDGERLDLPDLGSALGRFRNFGLRGYDHAMDPVPGKYDEGLVSHKHFDANSFEGLIDSAANLTATTFWPAAMTYLHSPGETDDRRAFLDVMGNWNLDTGYNIRVYSRNGDIHVRYESSWAKYPVEDLDDADYAAAYGLNE